MPPSVALGIRFGCRGASAARRARDHAPAVAPAVGERFAALALGLFLYAVESTLFYMGLERGTAAAVALDLLRVSGGDRAGRGLARRDATRAPRTIAALLLAVSGSAVVAVGGGDVAITPAGMLCVCGSIATFSTYVLVSDRVLVRTDSLTAATWTALGASIGVTFAGFVQGVLEMPVRAGVRGAARERRRDRGRVHAVLRGARPHRRDAHRDRAWRSKRSSASSLSAIFLDESVKPIVAVGGVAVLAGAVLAALATPAADRGRKQATVSP